MLLRGPRVAAMCIHFLEGVNTSQQALEKTSSLYTQRRTPKTILLLFLLINSHKQIRQYFISYKGDIFLLIICGINPASLPPRVFLPDLFAFAPRCLFRSVP
ncbi:hypothetical protein FKM82_014512 [Ascaphus truei]